MYTSIDNFDSKIYVNEKNNDKRHIKYEDYKFHTFDKSKKGNYIDLFGESYKRIYRNLYEYYDKKNEIGVISPEQQYIYENYNFNEDEQYKVNICFLDIETSSIYSFPNIDNPIEDIQLIGLYFNGIYTIYGIKELDNNSIYIKDLPNLNYIYCKSQKELLLRFFNYLNVNEIDLISGWNSHGFDIPYIIEKTKFIENIDKKEKNTYLNYFSPYNKIVDIKNSLVRKYKEKYKVYGLQHLDYMELYKKFGKSQENYKLNFIGEVELGIGKEKYDDDYKDLNELYEKNYELFVRYNYRDVEILNKIDKKLGLMELVKSISYYAGINFEDVYSPIKTWDSIIYRQLMNKNTIVVKNDMNIENEEFPGAYVFDVKEGLNEWIISYDFASLYPTILRSYCMSYETLLVEDEKNIEIEKQQNELKKQLELINNEIKKRNI